MTHRRSEERERLVEVLRTMVLAEDPSLPRDDVHGRACLSNELRFDSLRLASFFTAIRTRFGEVNLVPWFLHASRSGHDSLDGLAEHLLAVLPRPGAWRRRA